MSVQHCLLTLVAARSSPGIVSGAEEEHALQGVCYRYSVPAHTEFGESGADALFGPPGRRQRAIAVFLRLHGRDAGSTQLLVRTHYEHEPDQWRETMRLQRRQAIPFPDEGGVVLDLVVNLPYLRVGGVGLHAISVHFRPAGADDEPDAADEPPMWQDGDEWAREPGWEHGATEYFEIVRGK